MVYITQHLRTNNQAEYESENTYMFKLGDVATSNIIQRRIHIDNPVFDEAIHLFHRPKIKMLDSYNITK
jgi:hypothetical protein